jgi:predicted nucleic acid-binding protein
MDTEIGAYAAPAIENSGDLMVPSITLYEVYKKLLTERGEEYALDVVSYMQTGTVIELTAGLSLAAAHISRKHKLPMADSIIYATTLHYAAILFTCDNHFKDIVGIRYFPKSQ